MIKNKLKSLSIKRLWDLFVAGLNKTLDSRTNSSVESNYTTTEGTNMAGIGRPKGQKGHNPVRADAVNLFMSWRRDGEQMIVSQDRAHTLTNGVIGQAGSEETMSLSAVALKFSIHTHKRVKS